MYGVFVSSLQQRALPGKGVSLLEAANKMRKALFETWTAPSRFVTGWNGDLKVGMHFSIWA